MGRAIVDWESVERDYRAGVKTLRQIGEENGCSHTAIKKRAEREEWTRDLAARIKEAAEVKVSKEEVSKEVSSAAKVSERLIIEVNSDIAARAIISERKDVSRARSIVQKLFSELEGLMDNIGDLDRMAEIISSGDDGAMQDLLRKVSALPTKTDVAKKLSESLRILVELERKVLKLDEQPTDPVEAAAKGAAEGAAKGMSEATRSMLDDLMGDIHGDAA